MQLYSDSYTVLMMTLASAIYSNPHSQYTENHSDSYTILMMTLASAIYSNPHSQYTENRSKYHQ